MRTFICLLILFPSLAIGQYAIQIPSVGFSQASVLDDNGNAYVTGIFDKSLPPFDIDRGADTLLLTPEGTSYIASYDQMGNLRFGFVLEDLSPNGFGTFNTLNGQTLLVDQVGNIFLIGLMTGWLDFDPSSDVHDLQTVNFGESHAFIASYDTDGNFRFLHDLGRSNNNKIHADVSDAGEVSLTFSSFDEVTIGDTTFGNTTEMSFYIINFSHTGTLNWYHNFNTAFSLSTNTAARMQVDEAGNIYLMNVLFRNIDLDPGPAVVNLGVDTLNDKSYYIASYSPNGTLRYAHKLSENFQANSLAHIYDFQVDPQENVYVYGPFVGNVNFEAQGNYPLISAVGSDMFLVSYTPTGQIRYGHSLGFEGTTTFDGTEARPLYGDLLPDGRLVVSGWFTMDKDFDPTTNEKKIERRGNFQHTFVNVYNANGDIEEALGFVTKGRSGTFPSGLNVNADGKILVSGSFADSVDFNPLAGEKILVALESTSFLTLLDSDFSLPITTQLEDLSLKHQISLYPNPTKGNFNLSIPVDMRGTLRVVSMQGQIVFQEPFNWKAGRHRINLPSKASGIFHVQMVTDEGVWTSGITVTE